MVIVFLSICLQRLNKKEKYRVLRFSSSIAPQATQAAFRSERKELDLSDCVSVNFTPSNSLREFQLRRSTGSLGDHIEGQAQSRQFSPDSSLREFKTKISSDSLGDPEGGQIVDAVICEQQKCNFFISWQDENLDHLKPDTHVPGSPAYFEQPPRPPTSLPILSRSSNLEANILWSSDKELLQRQYQKLIHSESEFEIYSDLDNLVMQDIMRGRNCQRAARNSSDITCLNPEASEQVYNMTGETGSFVYMSPEVFLHLPYNEKADVYSFGMVMYEVFSGVLISMTSFQEMETGTLHLIRILFLNVC
jgi:hypothetical protein